MAACQNAKETLDLLKEPHTDSWKERAQLVSLHLHQIKIRLIREFNRSELPVLLPDWQAIGFDSEAILVSQG
jgi:hypothetical protein